MNKDMLRMFNFTPFPNITTARLILRQITEDDLNDFFILKSDERLLKYYQAKPRTYEEARRKLKELNQDIANNESITWGITLKDENRLIGSICLWNLSEACRKAEIGYELMHDWQGKGIMREAVKAVIAYGFKNINLQKIEAVPDPNHEKSIKLLEAVGFIREKIFSETEPHSGRQLERVLYLMVNPFVR